MSGFQRSWVDPARCKNGVVDDILNKARVYVPGEGNPARCGRDYAPTAMTMSMKKKVKT